ncbi:MAG: sulfite exporter TauE/SafE family protein [Planctomycetaceae bacterium]|jgi:cytochrome c biogenesis protein CcdA|nr:sulfite exporter TauE/SafE family protein [Planctomycetaceae bacterium]
MLFAAFFLGLQTSISPCPLTANITAISYIAHQRTGNGVSRFPVLTSGLFYAAGQMFAYTAAVFCIIGLSLYSGSELSRFLTSTLHRWLPAAFVLIGIILLMKKMDYGQWTTGNSFMPLLMTNDRLSIFSSFFLGAFYALAFCPTTAAMFLAMLALAMKSTVPLAVTLCFGLGTALPVVVLSYLLAFQLRYFGKTFNAFKYVELWSRPAAGVIFIAAGVFMYLV